MSNEIYPNVGTKGLFNALPPFVNSINPQLSYEVISVDTIDGLIAKGSDPLNEIYIAHGLTAQIFNDSITASVKIITLQAATGDLITIPNDYLSILPDSNGIKYSCVMLGISLSAIPDQLDLTTIKQEISDLVRTRIGVNNTVKAVVLGAPNILTIEQHYAVEANRAAVIAGNKSLNTQLIELTAQRDSLLTKISQLENYIKINLPPP